jgi:hypothetical protein
MDIIIGDCIIVMTIDWWSIYLIIMTINMMINIIDYDIQTWWSI